MSNCCPIDYRRPIIPGVRKVVSIVPRVETHETRLGGEESCASGISKRTKAESRAFAPPKASPVVRRVASRRAARWLHPRVQVREIMKKWAAGIVPLSTRKIVCRWIAATGGRRGASARASFHFCRWRDSTSDACTRGIRSRRYGRVYTYATRARHGAYGP